MKIFFLLLLIFSCSKIKRSEVPGPEQKENLVTGLRNADAYSPDIDVVVAFLWPRRITGPHQRPAMEKVIATSRKLTKEKERYLTDKKKLKDAWAAQKCPCVLDGVCDGTETELNEEACIELEDAFSKNDQSLVTFYQYVEDVKAAVKESGGEWMDTSLEFKELPFSKLFLDQGKLRLEAFDSYVVNGKPQPIAYDIEPVSVIQEDGYQRLAASFPRLVSTPEGLQEKGIFTIKADIKATESTLTFQGELTWSYDGYEQLGVIYWENPRK